MQKDCPDCRMKKPKEDFSRASPRCKSCAKIRLIAQRKAAQDRYRRANRELLSQRNKVNYIKNLEQRKKYAADWRAKNKDRVIAIGKRFRSTEAYREGRKNHRLKNKEKNSTAYRKWYVKNRDRQIKRIRSYKEENKTVLAEKRHQKHRDHPEYARYARALRRAKIRRAMPSWADPEKIKAIYAEAARLTSETGIEYHVDHIYPLTSDWVCGLHVETNLQILPGKVNQMKSNKLPEAINLQSIALL
jgi:hypothetical protein